ncbi:MAG: response regulator transcription factor, partial [Firmicutes bacterium]|nr:response regulator transcription factor [Bacillota bacterium]
PIDLDILIAKIYAIWNRYEHKTGKIISGNLVIDREAHQVFLNNKLVELSLKEFELLFILVKNEGKTLHKNYLFQKVWGDSFSEEQTLTVHITMLRSKIEENPRVPKRIITVWGVGYRYEKV